MTRAEVLLFDFRGTPDAHGRPWSPPFHAASPQAAGTPGVAAFEPLFTAARLARDRGRAGGRAAGGGRGRGGRDGGGASAPRGAAAGGLWWVRGPGWAAGAASPPPGRLPPRGVAGVLSGREPRRTSFQCH